jgi:hypothetical protein
MDIWHKEAVFDTNWEELRMKRIPALDDINSAEELRASCPLVISSSARITCDTGMVDRFEIKGQGYVLSQIMADNDLSYSSRFYQVRVAVDWSAVALLLKCKGVSDLTINSICESCDLERATSLLGIE